MRTLIAILLAIAVLAPAQAAHGAESPALDPDLASMLGQAFQRLAGAEDLAAAEVVVAALADGSLDPARWRAYFESEAFAPAWFTPVLASFWEYAARDAGLPPERTAAISGLCASGTIAQSIDAVGGPVGAAVIEPITAALDWLAVLAPGLPPNDVDMLFEALRASLGELRVPVVPLSGQPPIPDPALRLLGMRLALTLWDYAPDTPRGRAMVGEALRMTGPGRAFWERHGIFLFDNGILDEDQFDALDQLIERIPDTLHEIAVLIVSEGPGDDTLFEIPADGQIVSVDPIPMGLLTEPNEFAPTTGRPVAPVFVVATATKIVRAIQDTQFALRPALRARLDMILSNAGDRHERYLRRGIPPAVYLNNPDELLPAIAYLWFVDTDAALRHAMNLFQIEQREAMDSLLLFADLMSGGGNAAPGFYSAPDGTVTARMIGVERAFLAEARFPRPDRPNFATSYRPVEIFVVNVVHLGGETWRFELDDRGISIRVSRRR